MGNLSYTNLYCRCFNKEVYYHNQIELNLNNFNHHCIVNKYTAFVITRTVQYIVILNHNYNIEDIDFLCYCTFKFAFRIEYDKDIPLFLHKIDGLLNKELKIFEYLNYDLLKETIYDNFTTDERIKIEKKLQKKYYNFIIEMDYSYPAYINAEIFRKLYLI
jgi:hypothetical protein